MTNRHRMKEKGWKDFHLFLSPFLLGMVKEKAGVEKVKLSEVVRRMIRSYQPEPPVEKIITQKQPQLKPLRKRAEIIEVKCKRCGKVFVAPKSHHRTFCGRMCARRWMSENWH